MRFPITVSENSTGFAALLRTLCVAGLVLGVASLAQARTEALSWSHEAPSDCSGFRVYVGYQAGQYTDSFEAGYPAHSGNVFSYQLVLPEGFATGTIHIAVSALRPGEESALSNDIARTASDDGSTGGDSNSGADGSTPVGGEATLFFDNLGTRATGQHVPGWVDTRAWNSMEVDDSLFSVTSLSGNRVLTTSSEDGNIHSHFLSAGSSGWSSYELRGRMRVAQSDGSIGVTSHSQYNQEDVYYRLHRFRSEPFSISWHPVDLDAGRSCSPQSTGVTPLPNRWYRFRFVVLQEASYTQLRAKVWLDGDSEPVGWQAECIDQNPDRPTAGAIGLWSFQRGAKYWDDLEVIGLAGDVPSDGSGSDGVIGQPGQPRLITP